jgi:hypothetical protein
MFLLVFTLLICDDLPMKQLKKEFLIAIKMNKDVEIFSFNDKHSRKMFLDDLLLKFNNVSYALSEGILK